MPARRSGGFCDTGRARNSASAKNRPRRARICPPASSSPRSPSGPRPVSWAVTAALFDLLTLGGFLLGFLLPARQAGLVLFRQFRYFPGNRGRPGRRSFNRVGFASRGTGALGVGGRSVAGRVWICVFLLGHGGGSLILSQRPARGGG